MPDTEKKGGTPKPKKIKRWWPHLFITLCVLTLAIIFFIGFMAERFPVPDDAPMEIPFPDNGENVPGPEWLFLLFWLPFWYLKGRLKKYLFITSVIPIALFIYSLLLPLLLMALLVVHIVLFRRLGMSDKV